MDTTSGEKPSPQTIRIQMPEAMPEAALKSDRSRQPEEPPPLLRTWRRLYLAVLAWLAILILAFYWFARRFAP